MAPNTNEPHLKVYSNRSTLVKPDGTSVDFVEGGPTPEAKRRLVQIRQSLQAGYFRNLIIQCFEPDFETNDLSPFHSFTLKLMSDSVTSEVGRGLIGLTILQLCIKAIAPEQSIRLHKSGAGTGFSWAEGVPMRVIDKDYITPVLREFDLVRLNADGIMMTRSLAENYPYTKLYKAALRGARREWLEIVDWIENQEIDPESALKYLLSCLINRSRRFEEMSNNTLALLDRYLKKDIANDEITSFVQHFIDSTQYSARVFEVALHSMLQVLNEYGVLDGYLKPLCQMRSANKKHGNIADVEITTTRTGLSIIEGWDAKYGKPYLREELDEINEKLEQHPEAKIVGFIVDRTPDLPDDILARMQEINEIHGVKIEILSFRAWIDLQVRRIEEIDAKIIYAEWLRAMVESLCQRRREIAPIDEPCDHWVAHLHDLLKDNVS